MKFTSLFIAGAIILASCESTKNTANVTLTSKIDSVNYALGINMGESLKQIGLTEINDDILLAAMHLALSSDTTALMNNEEAMSFLNVYFQQLQQEKAKKTLDEGQKFLEENAKNPNVSTSPSGLQYQVLQEGTGATPTDADKVTVHYTGTFIDGKKFDSSYDKGQPATFGVTGVIKGWTEALKMMKEGGKMKIWVPSDLAYGPRGRQGIPGNSVLIFEMELIKVTLATPPAEGQE